MAEPTIIQIDNLTTQHQPADASFSFSLAQLYDSLPVDEGHIRILDLEPEPRHRLQGRARQPVVPPLRGTLRIVSLEDRPDFVALSYVWGSKADPPDLLLCNGCKIEITSNCKDALQAVQRSQGPVTIWVDAICINQKDNTEKASQIPNMEDIYTWARMVYVWLGPGDEHTDSIMKTLREASHRGICLEGNRIRHLDCKLAGRGAAEDSWTLCMQDLKDCWVYVRWVNPLLLDVSRLASPLLVLANYLPCQGERNYAKSLDSLLSRPWVNRAWTFQELILAQDITLMCGEQLLSWDRFVRGLWIWGYHHRYYHGFHHVYTLTQLPSFHRYRLHYKGPDLDHPKMKYFRECSPRSEVEVAIGATHVELAGKTLQIRGMIVCQVGFATETFEKIEHDDSDDELVVKLETRVATLCQLIHRARDLPFNAAYKTIAESILQTINGFKPENQPLEASDRVFEPDNGQLADPRRGPRFVRLGHVTESSDSVLQRDAEQFESSSSFSNLYKNIRATLNGVGDAQIDYLAVSMAVLQRHIPPLEYSAIADLCDKFAKRRLFDTLTGYLGLGPPGMRAGDFVAIVAGVPVPMVFRGTGSIDTYLVIGPAFVLGLMGKPDLDLSSVKDLNLV
ncbi:hypothetical protein GQX73_g5838 [Xylaria multiplex]|uniref:Heterokaryon incompatibility domain-containing protein n=1 Tax=Xylaria multiplex TaxID=323545 RepID=A0A7C8N3Y2_9PEZI|nr:hypothetical protein GQX73_g5838 [Xylaria multiplex]